MSNNRITFVVIFLFLGFSTLFSQVDREFWFAIPKITSGHGNANLDATNNVSFKITAMNLDANITISMPANPAFAVRNIFVPAGQSHVEILATTWAQFQDIYNNTAAQNADPVTCQTNRGILITSDNDITVYYDFDNYFNRDLYSLKGKNALGTEFYTPFQNIWANDNGYNPDPYSSIEIVATEDGTQVQIYPRTGYIFNGRANDLSWTITLNRGESYSLRATSVSAANHPYGTYIRSNKKIAVTTNDDSVWGAGGTCRDIMGDQLVPKSIIGSKYIVMSGDRSKNVAGAQTKDINRGDQIFVTATEPNTIIEFRDKRGVLLYTTGVLGPGNQDYFSIDISDPDKSSILVRATDASKKFYVFHITGIGCELGGAILPPITDCTGSNEVSFYRSNSTSGGNPFNITLNLMIPYDRTLAFNDPAQSHNYFSLITYNTNGTVASTFPIPGTWFESNDSAGWAVLKTSEKNFDAELTPGRAHKIVNTNDFFHLGITNGYQGVTNKYGYFSSFNATLAEVYIPQTQEDNFIGCYGDTITLVAKGGLEYTWHYGSPSGPPTYLSDPKSANPDVINCPVGAHNFYVEVRQAKCFGTDTLKANVTILPIVTARFDVDKMAICSPDTVLFTNQSLNANLFTWKKQIDAGPVFDLSFTAPNNPVQFREALNNPSITNPQSITYTLIAESNQGCTDRTSKTILLYPRVSADFNQDTTYGCNPLTVSFTNNSGGNTADSLYFWNFGDQGTSIDVNPVHTFKNFGTSDTTYNITLITKSPYYCTDTARSTVTVHPYIFANYAVDTVQGCSPLQINIQNGSLGAIDRYKWEYGDGDTSNLSTTSHYYTYRNTGIIDSTFRLKLTVFNAAGCVDSLSRLITAYPEISTRFTADIDTGCTPMMVSFTNLSNAAADSFYWNFGDGTSSYSKNPQHEYINTSVNDTVFKVMLLATTKDRCPGYDSTVMLIRGFIDPRFSMDTSQNCAPFNLIIKNNSIHHPTAIASWNFGDSPSDTITSARTITHEYRNVTPIPLNLNVRINITGSGGCNKTLIKPVRIFPEITADFVPDTAGCNPLPVNFRNLSTPFVSKYFTWNFGDSTSSVEKDPYHLFSHLKPTDQIYPVQLIAQSDYNCRDTITKNITVYSYINAHFAIDKGQGCSPLDIAITDSSSGGITSRLWNTGGTPVVGNQLILSNLSDSVVRRDLTLTVTNGRCIKSYTRPVIVFPQVYADYNVNSTIGCNPFTVDFTHTGNYQSIISKYRWEFGDYSASTDQKFTSHTFTNYEPTEYAYRTKLVVQSAYNCADSAEITIRVYPYIKANFGIDYATGCSPLNAYIENASSNGANEFTWIYGDGTPQSNTAAKYHYHLYNNPDSFPQTYQITLIASYNNGTNSGLCSDPVTQNVQVYPTVTAAFAQDTLQGCHPLAVTFTNQSSNAQRYNWYFGDKGTSIYPNPIHTYANYSNVDSIYNVTLVAQSEYNCENQVSKTVTIFPKPKARFNVDNSINCPPFTVPIENISEASDTFFWTFGDGQLLINTNLGWINHTYYNFSNDIATYDLELRAKTVHECSDRTSQNINVYPRVFADFTPDTAGCSPFLVPFTNISVRAENYLWNFGDLSTSKIQSPSHKFFNNSVNDTIFNVSMIGMSKFDCRDTAYGQVTVYPQPEARFIALPTHMTFPLSTVNIQNQTNAGFWNYLWRFDDGNTSTQRDPLSYSYGTWGEYNLSLVAYSNNCSDTSSQRVRIFPAKPVAKFVASSDGCVPCEIQFTDSSKYANSWKWYFDDGTPPATEQNPSHIYIKPGKYQVKLLVEGDGGTDFYYQEVNIHPKPIVDFAHNPNLVMLPDSSLDPENKERGWVKFTNKSKFATRFLWDFGDGETSIDADPLHQYKTIGTYDITLNAWTQNGCFDSVVHSKAIKVIVRKDIVFPNAFTPNPNGPNGGVYDLKDASNDVFHPHWTGIVEFKMEIYDRWGEKIFESKDINIGWDGYYKGKLCKSDVYVCRATGRYADGSTFSYVGDVTLIR